MDKFLAAISAVAIILIAAGAGMLIMFGDDVKTTPVATPTPKPSGNPWDSIPVYTISGAEDIAKKFVTDDETFKFDGMIDTLNVNGVQATVPCGYDVIVEFNCSYGGYGDRTGNTVTDAITPHKAVISILRNNVTAAVLDETYDMVTEKYLKA
ncbi:hypothetical protein CUJ83_08595 [Methanocella sp. CWC-04]|uniref:Uncharacterized protein n=1 Tax=Methanooceanicella nereidis TaxID=2052831 RepID=A0AAP2RCJ3_9EURY|nr:hypothetical protein [Methanocella sp. CWC-04]MCD1295054.1 hypothetical protein [Methanocella sp. CWC-04]